MAVAASKKMTDLERHLCFTGPFRSVLAELGFSSPGALPRGAILGWVTLTDCQPMIAVPFGHQYSHQFAVASSNPALTRNEYAFGNYAQGRFAWLTSDERVVLAEPIPFKGGLGLRDLPPEVMNQ